MRNKKSFSAQLFFLLVLAFILVNSSASAQMLKVEGEKIVNSSTNKEVILNAMNFGNWMVMEGYMMNSGSQAPDQHTWKKKLTTLIGAANTKTFYDKWLDNHVTQSDVAQVKAWGFNAVRVPLHYEYFVNADTPDVWNNQGFTLLDNLISWCKDAEIYVIIDLHAAPGGQSNNAISDYDNTKPSFWESDANKTKAVALWKKISERYKLESWVAGYDLINEPAWDLPNGTDLRNIYGRMTDVIRANSDNHILFIEGNWYANDYTGLTPAWDANMVYTFHKYWSANSNQDIKWITDFRSAQNRPIWCGEHGENSNDHFTKTAEVFNANGIGMSWWPMKKFASINDFVDAKYPLGYTDLLNYFGGTNPDLSPTTAFNTVMQLAENVKLANCTIQTEVVRSVFTQPGNRNTVPFSSNAIPGKLYTPNYDYGMKGYAYSDQAWEDFHITTGNYTAWNNGWIYRNNGVDIEATTDSVSNGYTVGWFNVGEWMKYTVNVSQPGTYTIEFRVASGNSATGKIQIQNSDGTEIIATADVPTTGGWASWKTYKATGVFKSSGVQEIRIANQLGEFNVNSVNFIYENSNVPALLPVVKTANVIYLKGNNTKYVTFSGTDNLMSSTNINLNVNEKFTVVDAGNGLIALKGSNGLYVTLNTSSNKLYCNSSTIGNYQKFTLDDLCGVYTIKGFNNLYVSSENGSASGLTCTRTAPGGWEYFNWGVTGTVEVLKTKSFENNTNSFEIYPNPAQNSITVSSAIDEDLAVKIYDMNGRELINTSIKGKQNSIDVNQLYLGVYLMKISGADKTEILKFIKK
jgi:endoglucanase